VSVILNQKLGCNGRAWPAFLFYHGLYGRDRAWPVPWNDCINENTVNISGWFLRRAGKARLYRVACL